VLPRPELGLIDRRAYEPGRARPKISGEMAEWLKAHAWKACVGKPTVGSNPTLSAIWSSVAETSRARLGAALENTAIPRGFGERINAHPNRRRLVRDLEGADSRIDLCCQVGRFGFVFDSRLRVQH
jgi:hypothetical protein